MSKELIERLRKSHIKGQFVTIGNATDAGDAADLIESLRQQLAAALAENQQLRTNARRVFEQEELKHDQAIAAVIFGRK
jgi:hypothetical protein